MTKTIKAVKVTSIALVDDSTLIAVGTCPMELRTRERHETERILLCT